MRWTIRLCVAGALTASVVVAPPVTADSHDETVLTDLHNPRGLTIDDNGDLYVAASGRGGTAPCTPGPEEDELCYGNSGHIHRVPDVASSSSSQPGSGTVVIDDLPSVACLCSADAYGPADVSVSGDTLYFTIGLAADPAVRDTDLEDATPANKEDWLATLRSAPLDDLGSTTHTHVADLGAHEATDPDGAGPDSNPFGLVASADTVTVLDAGGNTMLDVDVSADPATITTRTVFAPVLVPPPAGFGPDRAPVEAQSVPTQLALQDGQFTVGELTGFPFHPGSARVHTVDGTDTTTMVEGFTNIMDVAWHDGDLYVLEIFHDGLLNGGNGALVRVTTDGDQVTRELLRDDLDTPGGMAFHPADGMLYVTTGANAAQGRVIRFDASALEPLVTVVDDTATTEEDHRLVAGDAQADAYQAVTADVADNDTGVTTVSAVDNTHGAVYDGSIVYLPPAHFTGEDTITYLGCNDDDDCLMGVLGVAVTEADTDRIAGGTRIQTAIEASQGRYPDGAPVAIIARADLYPDALAGGPLARATDGPILLTSRDGLEGDVAAEITRLGAAKVYLLGGPIALSREVEDAVGALPTVTDMVRVEGDDRFGTAVGIRDELAAIAGADADHAYVVEGADADPTRGWPDAVSVSALASFQGRPILLVETDRMPEATADALQGIDATIIGGSVAIGAAVTGAIEAAADTVDRIAGDTRYETSRRVTERSFEAGLERQVLTLVSGGNWPDALVGGPLVAKSTGAFMLVHPTDLTQSVPTLRFMDDHGPFADVDLFGGTVAISTEVEAGIAAANGG